MTVPLERQKNIADVAPRVREQLGLGSAALSDVGDFATAAQGEKADNALPAGMLPITSSVQGLTAIDLPDGMTAIRTNGFNAMGDLGAWPLAVEVTEDGSALEPWQRQTNGGMRRFELRADVVSVKMFGAKGDGAADDATAIANALAYWKATGCTLVFPNPLSRYRMASGVLVDMAGVTSVGKIIMEGAISPDPGIGSAMTIKNARGGEYCLRVFGGGQTADYSQADPVGADQAFVFIGGIGCVIDVEGREYAGRVLRVTGGGDPTNNRVHLLKIVRVFTQSSAAESEPEVDRLAKGVGQSMYIDTYSPAFGEIDTAVWFWEKYGPVIERTADVTLHTAESLFRGVSGFEVRGAISFWGGKLNLGSELPSNPPNLLTIKSQGGTAPQNINIDQVFAIAGQDGIVIEDAGSVEGQGIRIGAAFTRLNKGRGLVLNNVRKYEISHHSYADQIAMETVGSCQIGDAFLMHAGAKRESLIVSSDSTQLTFKGIVADASVDGAGLAPLIRVDTTNPIFFEGVNASSALCTYLYDLVPANNVRITGGRVFVGGATQIFDSQPSRAINVNGWDTAARGIATILSGGTSVVVNHGLAKAPDLILVTGRAPTTASCYVTGVTSTQFTINVPSALPDNQPVYWRASLDYAG